MPLKTTPPWNVLVFPAASEVGLEIGRALGSCKEVVLHGCHQPGPTVAIYHFRRLHELPSIYSIECLPALKKLVKEQKIDAIFPAYDDVVVWLALHATEISATIIAPDFDVCELCRSKSATYYKFRDLLVTPQILSIHSDTTPFPVFVKPDRGQGSQRARRIASEPELKNALDHEPDLIVTEYLPGEEYTVDCFSQKGRGVLFAKARRRVQTKAGIATITQTEELPEVINWAHLIAANIDIRGSWFFQVKLDAGGRPRLLEIAPRIAGSMALTRVTGPNFPLLSLYDAAGYELDIPSFDINPTLGRSLDTRFHSNVRVDALYIDLDDTLILRAEINTVLIALTFQCHNRNIPVHLITRHKKHLPTTLETLRLTHIFTSVIHVTDDSLPKSSFIKEANAVLIDDSFAERSAAAKSTNIICFDAAGAVCLLDERR